MYVQYSTKFRCDQFSGDWEPVKNEWVSCIGLLNTNILMVETKSRHLRAIKHFDEREIIVLSAHWFPQGESHGRTENNSKLCASFTHGRNGLLIPYTHRTWPWFGWVVTSVAVGTKAKSLTSSLFHSAAPKAVAND